MSVLPSAAHSLSPAQLSKGIDLYKAVVLFQIDLALHGAEAIYTRPTLIQQNLVVGKLSSSVAQQVPLYQGALLTSRIYFKHVDQASVTAIWYNSTYDIGWVSEWRFVDDQWKPIGLLWVSGDDLRQTASNALPHWMRNGNIGEIFSDATQVSRLSVSFDEMSRVAFGPDKADKLDILERRVKILQVPIAVRVRSLINPSSVTTLSPDDQFRLLTAKTSNALLTCSGPDATLVSFQKCWQGLGFAKILLADPLLDEEAVKMMQMLRNPRESAIVTNAEGRAIIIIGSKNPVFAKYLMVATLKDGQPDRIDVLPIDSLP